MKLCIVGCFLFLFIHVEASVKVKIAQYGTAKTHSHQCKEKLSRCTSEIQTKGNNCSLKLPHDGGILNAKGEYIPGTWCTSTQFRPSFSLKIYRK